MAHEHEALHAPACIQGHAYYDEETGTAQLNGHTGQVTQNNGHYGYQSQEEGSDEGNLVQDANDEVAGGLAGTNAGNSAVVLPQVVGDLYGVILDSHIEVVESHDQHQVDHYIQHA